MADNNKFQVRRTRGGRPYGFIPTGEKIHKLKGNYAPAIAEPCCVPAGVVVITNVSNLGAPSTDFYHPTIVITGVNNKTYSYTVVQPSTVDTQAQLVTALNTALGMFGVFASVDLTKISFTLDPLTAQSATMAFTISSSPTL